MYHIERLNRPPLTNKEIIKMANIRTVLKNAKQVLFSDHEYFNKDITGVTSIKEVKEKTGVLCDVRLVGTFGNNVLYRCGDYNFTLTIIN